MQSCCETLYMIYQVAKANTGCFPKPENGESLTRTTQDFYNIRCDCVYYSIPCCKRRVVALPYDEAVLTLFLTVSITSSSIIPQCGCDRLQEIGSTTILLQPCLSVMISDLLFSLPSRLVMEEIRRSDTSRTVGCIINIRVVDEEDLPPSFHKG